MGSHQEDARACCPARAACAQQLDNFDEREITRTEAIIQSMTLQERRMPKLLNGSRRAAHREGLRHDRHRRQPARQALRAGREDDEDRRQGRRAAGPRHGSDPRREVRRREAAAPKKKGSKSGNPAKRAAENAALAAKPTGALRRLGLRPRRLPAAARSRPRRSSRRCRSSSGVDPLLAGRACRDLTVARLRSRQARSSQALHPLHRVLRRSRPAAQRPSGGAEREPGEQLHGQG